MNAIEVIEIRTKLPAPARPPGRKGPNPAPQHPSQSEFAAMLGLSVYIIQNWEQGKCEPSPEYIERIRRIEQEHNPMYSAAIQSARRAGL